MNVKKAAGLLDGGQQISWEQMEKINKFTKKPLEPEEVYVCSIRLCDNQIDRDGEAFATEALPLLAELFIGKTCISDHQWSAGGQVARVFDTEVVYEGEVAYVKAWIYLLQSQTQLVADLDGGIKKEVSIGCAMGRRICSVCGSDHDTCPHQKGQLYKGVACSVILAEPLDAYEVSFVAVPAQPQAGVLKAKKGGETEMAETELEALALLGKRYQKKLAQEAVTMGLTLDLGLEKPMLAALVDKLPPSELEYFHDALGKKMSQVYPQVSQLTAYEPQKKAFGAEFLI